MSHLEDVAKISDFIEESDNAIHLESMDFRSEGVYLKTTSIPEGYGFVDRRYKKSHIFSVMIGKLAVTDESGTTVVYNAPYVIESEAGSQRTMVAMTDAVIFSSHAVDDKIATEDLEDFLTTDPLLERIH